MKSNVLVVGPNIDMTIHGGIVTHMKLLLSLTKDEKFDFNLQVFTIGEREYVGEKVTAYKLLMSYFHLVWVLISKNIDIVHINSSMKNGSIIKNYCALIVSKLLFKKSIFQFHGGSPEDISGNLTFILKMIVVLSDKILVLTDDQMNIKNYLKKSKWDKVEKIPNYIEKRTANVNQGKNTTKVYFLFVGRIIREKGIFEIIEATKKLRDEGLDFQVDIMGDGSDLNKMKELVHKLKLEKYFIFHGFVTEDAKKDLLYTNSNVMVFPSYKEGFPYTILEAMLYKIAIISTGVGALSDVIVNNRNGFLVPAKDPDEVFEKMKYFILNPKEIGRMGLNSFDLIESKYSTEIMKLKLTDIYQG